MKSLNIIFGILWPAVLILSLAPPAEAADPAGPWLARIIMDNDQPNEFTLVLKKDGDRYSGTITDTAKLCDPKGTPLEEVVVASGTLSFSMAITFDGIPLAFAMELKISDDKLSGEMWNKAYSMKAPIEFLRKR
jgi:hypothetical protein